MKIDIQHLIFIALGFVLFTIIGTVSHECGHLVAAKALGYKATLHYGSMDSSNPDLREKVSDIYRQRKIATENKQPIDQNPEHEKTLEKYNSDKLLITLGGPLQTILTGMLGLSFLLFRRRKTHWKQLALVDWLAVFLSLFWLREVFNLAISILGEIISPNGSYFGGDEKRISDLLGLWSGTVPWVSSITGVAICAFVVFKVVPEQLRVTFILGAAIGGVSGFMLWMYLLGPILLP
ncbi:MAG: hypothetical protein AB8F78_17790 [Saprospiraceae bacterium]